MHRRPALTTPAHAAIRSALRSLRPEEVGPVGLRDGEAVAGLRGGDVQE